MGQPDKAVAYVQDASIKHIEEAIHPADWESDDLVIDGWLGDCPHDMITHATANVLATIAAIASRLRRRDTSIVIDGVEGQRSLPFCMQHGVLVRPVT